MREKPDLLGVSIALLYQKQAALSTTKPERKRYGGSFLH
jgi:hypothetical protein